MSVPEWPPSRPPTETFTAHRFSAGFSQVTGTVHWTRTAPAQLRRWIERHFTHSGVTPEWDAAEAMISRVGGDMTSLSGEIDKLTAYVKAQGRDHVTAADVEAVCCRGERYDAYALSNAILEKRRDAALAALRDEKHRKTEPVIVSSGIARVLADIMAVKVLMADGLSQKQISAKLGINDYRVKLCMRSASARTMEELERAVLACSDADRRLKTTGAGYEALERLVCEVGV